MLVNKRLKLKKIGFLEPEIYIFFIYGIILFLIFGIIALLFNLFIPKGTKFTIITNPPSANIFVDNKLIGLSPSSFYIENMDSIVKISKDNFTSYEISASKLIKNKKNYISISSDNSLKILSSSYTKASMWSLINNEDLNENYRIPNLFSDSVKDYLSTNDYSSSVLDNYLTSSVKLITNKIILGDYLKALTIAKSENKILGISSIFNSSTFISSLIEKYPDLPILINNKILENTPESNLFEKITNKHKELIDRSSIYFEEYKKDIKINNMIFKHIPNNDSIPTDVDFIHPIHVNEFYILNDLLSVEMYNLFLEMNNYWSHDNLKTLIDDKMVDNHYLENINNEKYITNISYYAADSWCKWATNYFNLPSGYKITLPTENMWYSIIHSGIIKDTEAWQWTSDPFFLYDHYLTDSTGNFSKPYTVDTIPRVVVGQNKYNKKVEKGRGVQSAQWCTPFTSFRPILIKE
ncbi:MAG: hypothetical protein JXR64_07085 [Spirochaetales bacterium]|nr:hypothetical protein [Spirochaetales bacterium]